MAKWFVETGDHVQGPFSTEMIQNRLNAGQFGPADKIWGRTLSSWIAIRDWSPGMARVQAPVRSAPTQQVQQVQQTSQTEYQLGSSQPSVETEIWHYASNGNSFGPLAWTPMIQALTLLKNQMDLLLQTLVWTRG